MTTDLVLDRPAGDLVLGLARTSLSLGGAVPMTNGSGLLVVTGTGVAGRISADLWSPPRASRSAALSVLVNTTGTAVDRPVVVGGTTQTLQVAAGPFLRVDGHHPDPRRPGSAVG